MKSRKPRLNRNARKWVNALRSGKFKQVAGALAGVDSETGEIVGFCCLGVLCELARKDGVDLVVKNNIDKIEYDGFSGTLPDSVKDWAGLRNDSGTLERFGKYNDLTKLNDAGKSFKQIARIIETKAKELFV